MCPRHIGHSVVGVFGIDEVFSGFVLIFDDFVGGVATAFFSCGVGEGAGAVCGL